MSLKVLQVQELGSGSISSITFLCQVEMIIIHPLSPKIDEIFVVNLNSAFQRRKPERVAEILVILSPFYACFGASDRYERVSVNINLTTHISTF